MRPLFCSFKVIWWISC